MRKHTMGEQPSTEQKGFLALIIAALLVGVAIATDGAVSRAMNGLGGLLWVGAAVWLFLAARHKDKRFVVRLLTTVALALALVMIAKPSDFIAAVVGLSLI